ncbi:MAG: nucleotide exchange factor GrpE [Solirubrobacterales bacterium]
MTSPRDGDPRERSAAGPVAGDGGALRAGASSTPPSPTPPADGSAAEDAHGSEASASPGSSPEAGAEVEKDIAALLSDTRRERDEYLELAKRTKADFENYRRRMAAEVDAARLRGKGELARELIDAIDNLERALQAAEIDPDSDDSAAGGNRAEGAGGRLDALGHGVLLVFRGLQEALARNGIEALDPKGEKFDPEWHEALSTQPGGGAAAGTVLEVVQKGYRLDGQLIRPARVVVSA